MAHSRTFTPAELGNSSKFIPKAFTADADIVGPGVLAAFFVTATVTVAAVVFAYLSDALDGSYLNELDRKVIAATQRKCRHVIKRVHTDLASHSGDRAEAVGELRKEILTQFILTLSDQQLVTGLAILIAGVSDPWHLSGYEFTVVLALAWFSSTTHLATLTALRKYMDSHGLVRHARIIGMVLVLLLLVFFLAVSEVSVQLPGSTQPVQCVFAGDCDEIVYQGPYLFNTVVVFMLLREYFIRISDLYSGKSQPWVLMGYMWWNPTKLKVDGLSYRERAADISAERRLSSVLQLGQSHGLGRSISSAMYQYQGSFLSSLPGVGFSYSYGIFQVILYRWTVAPPLTEESNRMGFGQIMPLLLLLLPILVAGETYYGERACVSSTSLPMLTGSLDYHNRRLEKLSCTTEEGASAKAQGTGGTVDPRGGDLLEKKLAEDEERYEQNVGDIERYFHRDIRVRVLQVPQQSARDTHSHKQTLLAKYDMVKRFEQQMDASSPVRLFAMDLTIEVVAAAAFNVSSTTASLVGTILILYIAASAVVFPYWGVSKQASTARNFVEQPDALRNGGQVHAAGS